MHEYEISRLSLEQLAAAILKRPSDFGTSDDRLFDTHGFSPIGGTHRDADALTRTNHAAILEQLQTVDPEGVEEGSCSHWAVGWTRPIILRVKMDDGSLNTPLLEEVKRIATDLADYCVMDEDALSQAESEELQEAWESFGRGEFTDKLEKLLYDSEESIPDEPQEQALEALLYTINDTGSSHEIWSNSYTGEPYFNDKAFQEATPAILKALKDPKHVWLLANVKPHHTINETLKGIPALQAKLRLINAANHPSQARLEA